MRTTWGQPVAAVLVACAVAALWLPWWTPPWHTYRLDAERLTDLGQESWRGTDVVGAGVSALAVVAALTVVAVVVAALRGATTAAAAWWVLGAAGVVLGTVAAAGIADWGLSPGAAVTLGAALVVAVGAVGVLVAARGGFARLVPTAVVLLALPVWFVPADGTPGADIGPYERLLGPADGTVTELAPGTAPAALTKGVKDLVPVDGAVGVSLESGVVAVDDDGRPFVRIRVEPGAGRVLGVVGGRVVTYRHTENELRVIAPAAPDDPAVVTGVESVHRLAADGRLPLAAGSAGALRQLDVTAVRPGVRATAGEFDALVPQPGPDVGRPAVHQETGAVAAVEGLLGPGDRLVTGARVIAGGLDPACGTTARAASSFLPRIADFAPAAGGGWWLAGGRRGHVELLAAAEDGGMRVVPSAALGGGAKVLADAAGTVFVLTGAGLFRLPQPETALRTPPEPDRDCAANPEVAGPARLTEMADAQYHLDVAGRTAEILDGVVRIVAPNGTTSVPVPGDVAMLSGVVPDGSGGAWWVETVPGGTASQLVHVSPAGVVVQRRDLPGGAGDGELLPDLSGDEPLVDGCRRVSGGLPTPLADLPDCRFAVVGPDGRGWALAEDGLYAFDPAGGRPTRLLAASPSTDVPVSVQLARGISVESVTLRRPELTLDSAGRPLVLSDDVLLGMTGAGELTVLAQDDRLRDATPIVVEGGAIAFSVAGMVALGY